MNWISVKDRLPEITKFLASETLLFVSDGEVYEGYYHENGCFYSSDSRFACHTHVAKTKYGQLPQSAATLWMPLPEPPKV